MHTEKAYWLPAHVRACSTATGTVLLDLRRNRYFGVGRKETAVLRSLAGNWQNFATAAPAFAADAEPLPLEDAVRIADKLVDAGLLSNSAPEPAVFTPAQVDLDSLLTSVGHEVERTASIRWRHLVEFMRACSWARRSVRSRTLYVVAEEIGQQKNAAGAPFDAERAIELVGIFRRLRPHTFAARDQCLFHALALVRFLASHSVYPTWVIGVRTKPWAAHSWVQQGTLLLDANPEQVCEYTPILAI
ncbi:lasso peptide biosynthesis B2 protein [Steroidobacter sp. S1-65]|uniref:Lasso peptide biosynthesis B2 protein n=1 Tax=Steroidobacter gossypii TaxID=2805490 RepID=A0ABS1X639_9GAMM|nr:lasso peptide biosynthesis B2 protein [Steroidobacter gossypii]MBM0108670.1 lasso peptide biosynthesis B2 protein [Steroidobacter gossypii]